MTDNQNSVTAGAVQPPTDRPLTAGDWIEWHGGDNPAGDAVVEIKLRNRCTSEEVAAEINWSHGFDNPESRACDIIAYRIARPSTSATSEVAPFAEGGIGHAMQERGYAHLKDYVLSTDGADYEPNEFERALLEDFMSGLLCDEAMFGPVRALLAQQAALASPPVSERERELEARVAELEAKLNTPEVEDFAQAVVSEAQHQRERWGSDHDAGKSALDWFWLVGYLSQKVVVAASKGDDFKAKHHTISTAAALANWHAAISGDHTAMRPGIDTPAFDRALTTQPQEPV